MCIRTNSNSVAELAASAVAIRIWRTSKDRNAAFLAHQEAMSRLATKLGEIDPDSWIIPEDVLVVLLANANKPAASLKRVLTSIDRPMPGEVEATIEAAAQSIFREIKRIHTLNGDKWPTVELEVMWTEYLDLTGNGETKAA